MFCIRNCLPAWPIWPLIPVLLWVQFAITQQTLTNSDARRFYSSEVHCPFVISASSHSAAFYYASRAHSRGIQQHTDINWILSMRRVVVPLVKLISQWRRRRSFEGLWSIRKDNVIELAGEHLKTLLNLCMQNETNVRSPFRWWWSQRKNNTLLPLFYEWRFQGKHNTKRRWTPLRYASIPHSLWANLPLSCMTVEDSFSVNDLYPISRVSVSADISIHRPLFCLSEVRNWIFFSGTRKMRKNRQKNCLSKPRSSFFSQRHYKRNTTANARIAFAEKGKKDGTKKSKGSSETAGPPLSG